MGVEGKAGERWALGPAAAALAGLPQAADTVGQGLGSVLEGVFP